MNKSKTPRAVQAAMRDMGEHLRQWRRLNRLTLEEVSDKSGVSVSTLRRLELGEGASLENYLRVARVLRLLDVVADAADPMDSDRGRALIAHLI